MVRFALQGFECDIFEASDGEDAVRLLREHAIDLLIADLNTPGLSGLELCRYVRGNPLMMDIPIVMLIDKETARIKETAREAGVSLCISKPFTPDQIFGLVNEILK